MPNDFLGVVKMALSIAILGNLGTLLFFKILILVSKRNKQKKDVK